MLGTTCELFNYLAHRKCRTNAGQYSLMAYGAAAGVLAVAVFHGPPFIQIIMSLMYAGLGASLGALEMKQCKRANHGK